MSSAGIQNLNYSNTRPSRNNPLFLVEQNNNVRSLNNEHVEDFFESAEERPHLIGRAVNIGRSMWRFVRRYNPLTQLLNLVEHLRCSKHIKFAASRNGAQTGEDIRQYHKSLMFDEKNPDETKLFRAHFLPGDRQRPLVILFLGNSQTHCSPTKAAGVNELYNRLRRDNDVDVMAFRAGCVSSELRHRFCLTSDCSLHTSVVFEHTANVVEDIIRERKPTSVTFVGYSFGGGTIDKLLKERWGKIGQGIPVAATAYIDAIRLGSYDLGDPIQTRPPHSNRHLNFYQNNSSAINGTTLNGLQEGDISIRVPNVTHDLIDNDNKVLKNVYKFIRRKTRSD